MTTLQARFDAIPFLCLDVACLRRRLRALPVIASAAAQVLVLALVLYAAAAAPGFLE